MIKTKEYRNLMPQLTGNKKEDKNIWKEISKIRKQYNMSEYSFNNDVLKIRKRFSNNIDSFTSQKIASNVWKAYEKFFYGNGQIIHYKKYNDFNSLEGKTNKTGIRFKDNFIVWKKIKIPVIINYNNQYEYQAMQSDIAYCRIIRKYVRNKYKYYVQIIFKGNPPVKINKETGEIKHPIG